MKIQCAKIIYSFVLTLVCGIPSRTAEVSRDKNVAGAITEVTQPTPFQFIRYRSQKYLPNQYGYGADDREFFNGLGPSRINRVDPGEDVKKFAPLDPDHNRTMNNGQEFISISINEGYLLVGVHHYSVATLNLYINYASYNLRIYDHNTALPVTGWNKNELRMQVPGTHMIYAEVRRTNVPINRAKGSVLVRKSENDVNEYESMGANPLGLVRPVPLPENEETAAKRGAVRVGDPMDLASKRLAEIPQGALAHPPKGSSWSSFWVYGDGLLAIEVDSETKVIRKLAYVLGSAGDSPVFLPLNRIHLTDGEMFMPIPPPPEPKNSPTTGVKTPDQNP